MQQYNVDYQPPKQHVLNKTKFYKLQSRTAMLYRLLTAPEEGEGGRK